MTDFGRTPPLLDKKSLAITACWLVIVNLFALVALNRLNCSPDTAFQWMPLIIKQPVQQSWNPIELHNRWDSYWYLDIAQNGYSLRGEEDISNVVFFPLYPLLIRWVTPLVGNNPVLAGWLLSCVFLLLAAGLLTRLCEEFHPEFSPHLPLVFLLAHPAAFFLNAVYTESLFLFLSVATVLWARRRHFLFAGLCAALASATRLSGLFLCAFLLIEFVQINGWRTIWTRRILPLAIAPLGTIAFFLYHWITFGDFFLYLEAQSHFGRDFSVNLADLTFNHHAGLANNLLDWSHTLVAFTLAIVVCCRLRWSYGAYMLISLLVPLSTGSALAMPRYSMVLFPMYMIAAAVRSPLAKNSWLFASTLFLALDIIRFVNHYWTS